MKHDGNFKRIETYLTHCSQTQKKHLKRAGGPFRERDMPENLGRKNKHASKKTTFTSSYKMVIDGLGNAKEALGITSLAEEPLIPSQGKSSGKTLWAFAGYDSRGLAIELYCKVLSKFSQEYVHHACAIKNWGSPIKKQDSWIAEAGADFCVLFVKTYVAPTRSVNYKDMVQVIEEIAVNTRLDPKSSNLINQATPPSGNESLKNPFDEPCHLLPRKIRNLGERAHEKSAELQRLSAAWRAELAPLAGNAPLFYAHGSLHRHNFYQYKDGEIVVFDWESAKMAPLGYDIGYIAGHRGVSAYRFGAVYSGKDHKYFSLEWRAIDNVLARSGNTGSDESYCMMVHQAIGVCYAQYINRVYEYFTQRLLRLPLGHPRVLKRYLMMKKYERSLYSYFQCSRDLVNGENGR